MRSNPIWLRQITTEASISNYNFVAGTRVSGTIRTAHCSLLKVSKCHTSTLPPLPRRPFIPSGLVSDHFPFAACARVMTANDRFYAPYTDERTARIREESYGRGIVAWRRIASITRIVTAPPSTLEYPLVVIRRSYQWKRRRGSSTCLTFAIRITSTEVQRLQHTSDFPGDRRLGKNNSVNNGKRARSEQQHATAIPSRRNGAHSGRTPNGILSRLDLIWMNGTARDGAWDGRDD